MASAGGFRTLARKYKKATKGVQNYGHNIAKNVSTSNRQFAASLKAGKMPSIGNILNNPLPNPFKASSYRK